ncbi:TGF-beta receptor type-2-like [Vanacampus margaritifer]
MWCDASSPTCGDRRGHRVCFSNCSLSSFCSSPHDICVALWRETNASVSVRTMCHNPALPLEGVGGAELLLNSTSHECHMTGVTSTDGSLKVCACRGQHECNDKLVFRRRANGLSSVRDKDVIPVVLVSLVPAVLVLVIVFAIYGARTRRRRRENGASGPTALHRPDCTGKNTAELLKTAARSGAPVPTVRLEAVVGGGGSAQVWRARLLDEGPDGADGDSVVAVKVFPAAQVASWRHEGAILGDGGMRHRNVIQFLGAQVRGGAYWLLLAYHRLGNLQDFLRANVLDWKRLVTMATGLARGLAHLHSDALRPPGAPKVPVAHGDVKSSNVLLKDDGDVTLCDLGLAVRLHAGLAATDLAQRRQVGTARYMSPEALESRVNLKDDESFKQMDVYSMALVFWEMASRCRVIGEVAGYSPPFSGAVGERPRVDVMRDLVIGDRRRPDIPRRWTRHRGMSVYCETVAECWDHDPEARLTAHCVLERMLAFGRRQQEEEVPPC